jgi:DNA-binding transcriptional ArsR family regulator
VPLDLTIKALADPTRREILKVLREGDLPAGEIAARFPMTGASVSHHLSVLKDAGLVSTERDGRSIIYSLESTVFQQAMQELMEFFEIGEES